MGLYIKSDNLTYHEIVVKFRDLTAIVNQNKKEAKGWEIKV